MQSLSQSLPRIWPEHDAPQARLAPMAAVFLPKEHGSWSLALEPLALAIVLAPSVPGIALLAACLAGFFCRRPCRAAFASEFSPRRQLAREALVTLSALVAAGGFEVLVLGEPAALWPLALAVPCAVLFAYFDAQGEGRAIAAELAGSATFAVLPATFAILAGWSRFAALGLVVLALVRSVPTVLTIRTFLRQRKGELVNAWVPTVTAALGLMLVLLLVAAGSVPRLAAVGAALLLARSGWLTGPWRPQWTARRAGIAEAVLGFAYLLLVAGAYAFPSFSN